MSRQAEGKTSRVSIAVGMRIRVGIRDGMSHRSRVFVPARRQRVTMFARNKAMASAKCSFGIQLMVVFCEEDGEEEEEEEEDGCLDSVCGDCDRCCWYVFCCCFG